MKIDIQLELKDSPGQLGSALAIVARYGGNIQSVHHDHGRARNGWVPVRLALEISEEGADMLVAALREESRVLSVLGDVKTIPYAFLLLGHVFQSQISDVTDAVFATGAELRTVRAEVSGRDAPSAVLMEIAAATPEALAAAQARVAAIAREKGLVYVGALADKAPVPIGGARA